MKWIVVLWLLQNGQLEPNAFARIVSAHSYQDCMAKADRANRAAMAWLRPGEIGQWACVKARKAEE